MFYGCSALVKIRLTAAGMFEAALAAIPTLGARPRAAKLTGRHAPSDGQIREGAFPLPEF